LGGFLVLLGFKFRDSCLQGRDSIA
jgi:hypothetical protein